METTIKFANDLIDFLYESPTAFQAVRNVKAALIRKGFKQLHRGESWNLEKGGRYFTTKNASSLVAFIVGTGEIEKEGYRIIAAHTDSPALKIKPSPEMTGQGNYLKLNVETYGGPILSTWMDRPLSLAGRVSLKSENVMRPEVKYINIRKPIMVIPNLAIHLNRTINESKEYNKQKDMLPILRLVEEKFEKDNYLKNLLAKYLHVENDKIMDFDLNLYEFERGSIIGENNDFISAGRIDDLSMVHAGIDALFNSRTAKSTNVMICFDNEEVGSETKQGAASPFLKDVLKRVTWAQSTQRDAFYRAKINSFGISADNAHAIHPNLPENYDPVLQPKMNEGPVIKVNANQKYTTDALSSATFQMLCEKAGVPVQMYVNKSDIAGGSTLGSISSTQLDIRMVDVGNAMLAMHSIRELCGVKDHYYMKQVFDEFYK
ncbi:MAG: M18 family aminopeptidase [Bacteroidales bacterium]|nr:M18 family aminopeptidase [Bacteroidales bacterium]